MPEKGRGVLYSTRSTWSDAFKISESLVMMGFLGYIGSFDLGVFLLPGIQQGCSHGEALSSA